MPVLGPNRLLTLVHSINRRLERSTFGRQCALSLAFNSQIKYAGTTGIWIESLTEHEAVVRLSRHWWNQNHIGGLHACAMACLAESTTGMLFGLHVPDTHVPVLKSMNVAYLKRVQGPTLRAVARLTPSDIKAVMTKDRGEVSVSITVVDLETEQEPIECDMIWAWTNKRRREPKTA